MKRNFVHSHTERGSCDDDLYLTADESILIGDLFGRVHLSVVRPGRKTVAGQLFRQQPGPPGSGDIDNCGTISLLDEGAEHIVLVCLCLLMEDRIKDYIVHIDSKKQVIPRGTAYKLQYTTVLKMSSVYLHIFLLFHTQICLDPALQSLRMNMYSCVSCKYL